MLVLAPQEFYSLNKVPLYTVIFGYEKFFQVGVCLRTIYSCSEIVVGIILYFFTVYELMFCVVSGMFAEVTPIVLAYSHYFTSVTKNW